jgi:rhodanese-related sulfurtransferase
MMNRHRLPLIALAACAVLAAGSALAAEPQSKVSPSHAKAEVAGATEMNAEKLKQRLDAGEEVFLLDVRGPQELAQEGMIEGAVNIPIDDLASRLAEVPKDKPVTVYCHVGGRASRAAALLRKNGYTEPIEYGGITAWKEKGYAVAYPSKTGESKQ